MIHCVDLALLTPSLFVIALINTVKGNLDLAYRNFLVALKDKTHDIFGLRVERADPLDVRQILINADADAAIGILDIVAHEDISVHEVGILGLPLLLILIKFVLS